MKRLNLILLYGNKTVKTKNKKASDIHCLSCGRTNSTVIQFYQKYYHIYWLPIIPVKRWGVITCTHCGYTTDSETMNDSYQPEYKKLRPAPPIWMFTGSILSALLFGFVYSQNKSKNTAQTTEINICKTTPATAGKIYQIGLDNNYKIDFSGIAHESSKLIYITSVTPDSVYYQEGNISRAASEDIENLIQLDKQVARSDDKHAMTLANFKKLEILNCK